MKTGQVLIIACGALARELGDVLKGARFDWVDIECLPAVLHNTPQLITDAVRERIDRASGRYQQIFVGYADCGTGGMLDRLLDERDPAAGDRGRGDPRADALGAPPGRDAPGRRP